MEQTSARTARRALRTKADVALDAALGADDHLYVASQLGADVAQTAAARLRAAGCVLPEEELEAAMAVWAGAAGVQLDELLADYVGRRERGEPPAYILGGVQFCGAWVAVGPGAFIPRPWTEAVADMALRVAENPGHAVDVGTGAGPLAMALAAGFPTARVWATESDPDALRWAHTNLERFENVTVLEGDLFGPLPGAVRGEVEIVVGCLPYVPTPAVASLPRDFREYEPIRAFDGGTDGLRVIEQALDQGREWLRPGGWVLLEIGAGQGSQAVSLAARLGYDEAAAEQDADGDDAMLVARR